MGRVWLITEGPMRGIYAENAGDLPSIRDSQSRPGSQYRDFSCRVATRDEVATFEALEDGKTPRAYAREEKEIKREIKAVLDEIHKREAAPPPKPKRTRRKDTT